MNLCTDVGVTSIDPRSLNLSPVEVMQSVIDLVSRVSCKLEVVMPAIVQLCPLFCPSVCEMEKIMSTGEGNLT